MSAAGSSGADSLPERAPFEEGPLVFLWVPLPPPGVRDHGCRPCREEGSFSCSLCATGACCKSSSSFSDQELRVRMRAMASVAGQRRSKVSSAEAFYMFWTRTTRWFGGSQMQRGGRRCSDTSGPPPANPASARTATAAGM